MNGDLAPANPPAIPPALRSGDLHVTYPDGTRALRGVDLAVDIGERVVLLGANGSGKSTLLRTAVGLLRPTRGTIATLGTEVGLNTSASELRRTRRRVAMIFQRFELVPGLSVFQNVLFGGLGRRSLLRLTRLTAPDEERDRAMAALDRVGLADFATRRADRLSGGQQQRVAIARALMQEPEMILADEPVASLDPAAGEAVMELLFAVAAERALTVICTLHQIEFAQRFGERIVALSNGRVVLDGTTAALDADSLRRLYQDSGVARAARI